MANPATHPDLSTVTKAQQQTWATGDYSVIALSLTTESEALIEAVDPQPGERVLDVACGSGNTALAAARRYCEVTGVDYVPALLERGCARAAAEGVAVEFRAGDALALPFTDASFDVVLSTFGVMFAPDQERAAAELFRVCAPGGKIGLASWTPEGLVADFFEVVSEYAAPPPGLASPLRWGTDEGIRDLLGQRAVTLRSERRLAREYFRSVEHAADVFLEHFGPTRRALEQLDQARRPAFRRDLVALFQRGNRATNGTARIEYEYLEVVAKIR